MQNVDNRSKQTAISMLFTKYKTKRKIIYKRASFYIFIINKIVKG